MILRRAPGRQAIAAALYLVVVTGGTQMRAPVRADEPPSVPQRTTYLPTWESLDKHPTPTWFMDAKVGLFIYPPHPNEQEFHGYWKARKLPSRPYRAQDGWHTLEWDPDKLARIAARAGARYVVFGIDPYSYFLAYPSRYSNIEGSPFVRMGSRDGKTDYVAEMAAAVRAEGLRFGIYRNYLHPGKNPYFLETTYELIDRYQPDTLWLDGDKLSYSDDELRSRELAAYYYNHSARQDEVALEDALGSYKRATWEKSLTHGDWFRKELSPPHSDITNGYFVRYETLYRWRHRAPEGESRGLVNNLVEWLVDSTSKNGNIEFTIHIGPDSLLRLEQRTLEQIGMWLEVNGEAIYGTRPWHEGKPESRTMEGIPIRYTRKGDALYASLFDWPRGSSTLPNLDAQAGTRIRMLGIDGDLSWNRDAKGLRVSNPRVGDGEGFVAEIPGDHAFVLKIVPCPAWVP